MKRLLSYCLVVFLSHGARLSADPPKAEKIEIKVLAILASENSTEIHPKLVEFAKLVRIKAPKLTGFKLDRSTSEKLELGQTQKFPLVDKEVVEVTVNKERNEKGRIMLTIKPPRLDQITYECACDKFFAMATQYYVGKGKDGKDRQQLFIAIMAKPCAIKK